MKKKYTKKCSQKSAASYLTYFWDIILLCSLTILFILKIQTVSAMATVLEGPVANPTNGYLLSRDTWIASEAEAISRGRHLVTIRNDTENQWASDTFNKFGGTVKTLSSLTGGATLAAQSTAGLTIINNDECANIAGTWHDYGYNVHIVLYQNSCEITGTCYNDFGCCRSYGWEIHGQVIGNEFTFTIKDAYYACDTCEIDCSMDLNGTMTINGDKMNGSGSEIDCWEPHSINPYTFNFVKNPLDVQTINPQSSQSFYENFFPSPKFDQLVSGGSVSNVIAADGESRLVLRIMADNDPGQVTITESSGNTGQNGSLASLDNYRNASPASSVSIHLTQYHGSLTELNGKYFGFTVYRAPEDFSGYLLTRGITLNISSSTGNSMISLRLRRPPIFISHGLWDGGNNPAIRIFRNMLWNLLIYDYSDKNENIDDYICLNDCRAENSKHISVGANKTRNNIRNFLNRIRANGDTVTQVDYLGHSMGGLWGRLVEQNCSRDNLTYDRGYLHKLITLDTPHGGSFLADIGQFILTNGQGVNVILNDGTYTPLGVILCSISAALCHPICDGAIEDLTSSECKEIFKSIAVPSHAFAGNKIIDGTSCGLTNIWPIYSFFDSMSKLINPTYGCSSWSIPTQSDYVVGLQSQEGGLSGNQLTVDQWEHWSSFNGKVANDFFDLLNKNVDDAAFANGFPASSSLQISQQIPSLKPLQKPMLPLENQTPPGEIQFITPANGAIVSPGAQVNVGLGLTGTLTLSYVLIIAPGSNPVDLLNPPYTTSIQIPADAYGNFVISALGPGTDGNLYGASVTLSVNNTATLQSTSVTPSSLYMDVGQTIDLQVNGTYSDGTVRSLNLGTQGTTYTSTDSTIVSIDENGAVTANAVGTAYIQVVTIIGDPVIIKSEVSTPYLKAGFSSEQVTGSVPLMVNFTDLSAGYVTGWAWDFGDGQTSTEQNPTHTYTRCGTFTVTLTVSGPGGETNAETKTSYITVNAAPIPGALLLLLQ